jgi:putative transposase
MAEIGDEDRAGWDEACRREAAIRDLLNQYPKRLRISVVEAVAWELEVSRATLYRLIARYTQTRTVEGLSGRAAADRRGTRVINSDEETLIREILERACLKPSGPPFQHVLEQIGVQVVAKQRVEEPVNTVRRKWRMHRHGMGPSAG